MTYIAPWISVPDGARALEFYTTAFGAVERSRLEDGGRIVIGQLAIDGAELWFQEDADSSPDARPGSVRMIVCVDDPDPLFERALAAGATQVAPMHDEHGWRSGRLADPFGHHWEIARQT